MDDEFCGKLINVFIFLIMSYGLKREWDEQLLFKFPKEFFNEAKIKLQIKSDDSLNILLLMDKVSSRLAASDFEVKILFNLVGEELINCLNNYDALTVKLAKKILRRLIENNENIEFILKLSITTILENNQWTSRHACLMMINIVTENRHEFISQRMNFTKKVIEVLVLCSKDKSDKVSILATEILTNFTARLENYQEVIQQLNSDILNEIGHISQKKRSENSKNIKNYLRESLNKESVTSIDNNTHESSNLFYLDSKGIFFGVFPKKLIDDVENDTSLEIKVESFEQIKKLLIENIKKNDFLKYSNSFYIFLTKFLKQSYSSINIFVVEIIDYMISFIPGINLSTNILSTLPLFIDQLKSNSIILREKINLLFHKLAMVIPTSQIFPFILAGLNSDSWIQIVECLNILNYIFTEWTSIYNDIDFSDNSYDVNIFTRPVDLFNHDIPKVSQTAKKLIKYVGLNLLNTESFIKTLQYYLNYDLGNQVELLFKSEKASGIKVALPKHNRNRSVTKIPSEDYEDNINNLRIYKQIENYGKENFYEEPVYLNENNLVESKDYSNIDLLSQGISKDVTKNYINYSHKNKIEKNILKSRLVRYNDSNDHDLQETYDKNYNYEYRPRENMSPLKNPESVYNNLYTFLKSHLNWEKQYKSLDAIRKILVYKPEMFSKDNYMTSLIVDEVVNLTCSLRSLLVRNALTTLSEIFQSDTINLKDKYENLFKKIIKRLNDKNTFIKEEAQKTLDQLIMNCDIEKATNIILEVLTKNTQMTNTKIILNILAKYVIYREKSFVNNRNFNKSMIFVTEIYHKYYNHKEIKEEIRMFMNSLRQYFSNDENYENLLKKYFGNETLNKILFL